MWDEAMRERLNELVRELRILLRKTTDEERLSILASVADEFCERCGSEHCSGYCTHDD